VGPHDLLFRKFRGEERKTCRIYKKTARDPFLRRKQGVSLSQILQRGKKEELPGRESKDRLSTKGGVTSKWRPKVKRGLIKADPPIVSGGVGTGGETLDGQVTKARGYRSPGILISKVKISTHMFWTAPWCAGTLAGDGLLLLAHLHQ